MTYEEQIAAIGALAVKHQAELGEVVPHIRKALRTMIALRDVGAPLDDKKKLLAPFRPVKKEKYKCYQHFVDEYFAFCERYINMKPVMDARQGKALREIIAYLIVNCKAKDEAGAMLAWQFVFEHWEKLTPHIRNQTTLAQIKNNLQEILTQLRNGNTKQQTGRRTSSQVRARAQRSRTQR